MRCVPLLIHRAGGMGREGAHGSGLWSLLPLRLFCTCRKGTAPCCLLSLHTSFILVEKTPPPFTRLSFYLLSLCTSFIIVEKTRQAELQRTSFPLHFVEKTHVCASFAVDQGASLPLCRLSCGAQRRMRSGGSNWRRGGRPNRRQRENV